MALPYIQGAKKGIHSGINASVEYRLGFLGFGTPQQGAGRLLAVQARSEGGGLFYD